jgi:hypothetical protein
MVVLWAAASLLDQAQCLTVGPVPDRIVLWRTKFSRNSLRTV